MRVLQFIHTFKERRYSGITVRIGRRPKTLPYFYCGTGKIAIRSPRNDPTHNSLPI